MCCVFELWSDSKINSFFTLIAFTTLLPPPASPTLLLLGTLKVSDNPQPPPLPPNLLIQISKTNQILIITCLTEMVLQYKLYKSLKAHISFYFNYWFSIQEIYTVHRIFLSWLIISTHIWSLMASYKAHYYFSTW